MEIKRAYKVELDPNNQQRTLLRQHAGAARWAYNWGLARRKAVYKETGKSISAISLHKELNQLKLLPVEEGGVPWMYETSKCAPQEALRNLDKAYDNFFRRCRQRAKKKGFPKFKTKRKSPRKFRLTGVIKALGTHVQLPNLGKIRLKERGYLPQASGNSEVKTLSASLSEHAGRWFVSLAVKEKVANFPTKRPKTKVVGVDVGIKSLAVTSDGTVYENPRALKRSARKLRTLQKALSRKLKGSGNRQKAKSKVARAFYRVACVRSDAIHKATSDIVRSADVICIESLNVKGMLKNHCIAGALADAGLGEFLQQIKYKASWAGTEVIEAPGFYPSSKTCSGCGHVKDSLKLSDRVYKCSECGLVIDRDLNASINLKLLAGSSSVTACCLSGSGLGDSAQVKPPIGQESNCKSSAPEQTGA